MTTGDTSGGLVLPAPFDTVEAHAYVEHSCRKLSWHVREPGTIHRNRYSDAEITVLERGTWSGAATWLSAHRRLDDGMWQPFSNHARRQLEAEMLPIIASCGFHRRPPRTSQRRRDDAARRRPAPPPQQSRQSPLQHLHQERTAARPHRNRRRRWWGGRRGRNLDEESKYRRGVSFTGFPPSAFEFYERLEADNSKVFWQDNKAIYESAVKLPMEELCAELDSYGAFHLFRPYNDLRFAKGRPPYKTAQGAITESEGGCGYYVQLSADGLMTAAGFYMMAKDQLERFRAALDDDDEGPAIDAVVDDIVRAGYSVGAHDELKTAPRG